MKFSGVITIDRSDVHATGPGQRLKVKVTEIKTVSGPSPQLEFTYGDEMMHKAWCGIEQVPYHYNSVIMSAIAPQITCITIVYSTVYSRLRYKTPKLRATGLYEENSLVISEFTAHKASNVENVSIWWLHRVFLKVIRQIKVT